MNSARKGLGWLRWASIGVAVAAAPLTAAPVAAQANLTPVEIGDELTATSGDVQSNPTPVRGEVKLVIAKETELTRVFITEPIDAVFSITNTGTDAARNLRIRGQMIAEADGPTYMRLYNLAVIKAPAAANAQCDPRQPTLVSGGRRIFRCHARRLEPGEELLISFVLDHESWREPQGGPVTYKVDITADLPSNQDDLTVTTDIFGFVIGDVSPTTVFSTAGSVGDPQDLEIDWHGKPSFPVEVNFWSHSCPEGWTCPRFRGEFGRAKPLVGRGWATCDTGARPIGEGGAKFLTLVDIIDNEGRREIKEVEMLCIASRAYTVAGTWNTNRGPMQLRASGRDRAFGDYGTNINGKVDGNLRGQTLSGQWYQAIVPIYATPCAYTQTQHNFPYWGRYSIVFDEEFNSFRGTVTDCNNLSRDWAGWRVP